MATFASSIFLNLFILSFHLALFRSLQILAGDGVRGPTHPSHYSRNVTASRAVLVMVTVYGSAIQTMPP